VDWLASKLCISYCKLKRKLIFCYFYCKRLLSNTYCIYTDDMCLLQKTLSSYFWCKTNTMYDWLVGNLTQRCWKNWTSRATSKCHLISKIFGTDIVYGIFNGTICRHEKLKFENNFFGTDNEPPYWPLITSSLIFINRPQSKGVIGLCDICQCCPQLCIGLLWELQGHRVYYILS